MAILNTNIYLVLPLSVHTHPMSQKTPTNPERGPELETSKAKSASIILFFERDILSGAWDI